jgi:hypothetical protein
MSDVGSVNGWRFMMSAVWHIGRPTGWHSGLIGAKVSTGPRDRDSLAAAKFGVR